MYGAFSSSTASPEAVTGPGDQEGAFLRVEGLSVEFATAGSPLVAVDDVSFALGARERLGIVGESGSGKTVTVGALMGLFAPGARARGAVMLGGRDVLSMSVPELRSLRGPEVALVPQDPVAALSPVRRVGAQMAETLIAHRQMSHAQAHEACLEALAAVKVPSPRRQFAAYPFELSGGMLQRVCIATALLCEPKLLIADEATTALDVSVQASILELLAQVAGERSMALIVVSHDMSVIAGLCETTAVMYAGRLVEMAPTSRLFRSPRHPYSAALLGCRPKADAASRHRALASIPGQVGPVPGSRERCLFAPRCRFAIDRCSESPPPLAPVESSHTAACWRSEDWEMFVSPPEPVATTARSSQPLTEVPSTGPLLEARSVDVSYALRRPGSWRTAKVTAVEGISFSLEPANTLGLVGESGCGKSTVGRAMLGLQPLASGSVHFQGQDLGRLDRTTMRVLRRRMQMVVQSSYSSFDPRRTIGEAMVEAARLDPRTGSQPAARARELLELVELPSRVASAMPAETSGGQRQRASIARALATRPALIVADEPTSSLDVSVRAGILNLLRRLQEEQHISYLFISHDLAAVRSMSDNVAVMYLGHLVEKGPADDVFERPAHPYTRALLDAVPEPDAEHLARPRAVPGEVPSLLSPPSGCPFHPRCPRSSEECRAEMPATLLIRPGHEVACFHPLGPTEGSAA